jgi:hypothetical protein
MKGETKMKTTPNPRPKARLDFLVRTLITRIQANLTLWALRMPRPKPESWKHINGHASW